MSASVSVKIWGAGGGGGGGDDAYYNYYGTDGTDGSESSAFSVVAGGGKAGKANNSYYNINQINGIGGVSSGGDVNLSGGMGAGYGQATGFGGGCFGGWSAYSSNGASAGISGVVPGGGGGGGDGYDFSGNHFAGGGGGGGGAYAQKSNIPVVFGTSYNIVVGVGGNFGNGGGNGKDGALGALGRVVISAPLSAGVVSSDGVHTSDLENDYWTFTESGTWTPYAKNNFIVSGVVTLDSAGVENALVTLIKQSTDEVLATQQTDVNGAYSFPFLDSSEKYHVTVEYNNGTSDFYTYAYWDIIPVEV